MNEHFVSLGMVADIALHAKTGNPHAHIMLTLLRDVEAEGFGGKRRDWNSPALVSRWREAWATACNVARECAGRVERIDHRSNSGRGIDLPPQYTRGVGPMPTQKLGMSARNTTLGCRPRSN